MLNFDSLSATIDTLSNSVDVLDLKLDEIKAGQGGTLPADQAGFDTLSAKITDFKTKLDAVVAKASSI